MADFPYAGAVATAWGVPGTTGNGDRVTALVVEAITTEGGAEADLRVTAEAVEAVTVYPNPAGARFTALLVETLTPNEIDLCADPDPPATLVGALGPVLWVEWDPDGQGAQAFAETDLNDASGYYGGYKAPRLLAADPCRRSFAGAAFDYEVSRFGVTLIDTDRAIRAILAGAVGRYFTMRPIAVRLIADAARRTGGIPRTIGAGYVAEAPAFDGLTVGLACRSVLGATLGWTMETQVPRKTIERTHFPAAAMAVLGKGLPIIFGIHSAAGHAAGEDVPVLDGNRDKDREAALVDGVWTCGWGDDHGPTPPTNVQATYDTDGGVDGGLAEDGVGTVHTSDPYYLQVFSLTAAGVPGDPYQYKTADGPTCLVDEPGGAIDVSWTPSTDPACAGYRVVLGIWYYTFRARQQIDVMDPDATGVTFNKGPNWTTPGTTQNMTAGAIPDPGQGFTYPTVAARFGDGETDKATPAAFAWFYADRHARLEWEPVAGATGYRVWFSPWPTAPFGSYIDVDGGTVDHLDFTAADVQAATVAEPPARACGAIPVLYTGVRSVGGTGYHEFLVCGHAIEEIGHWYYDPGAPASVEVDQDSGVEWWVPGTAAWASAIGANPYVDLVGTGSDTSTIRCTVVYGKYNAGGTGKADKVAAGTAALTLDLRGWETSGNGSGDVVDDVALQCADFLNYFVIGDGTGIRSTTPPMFPNGSVCQVNRGTFREVRQSRRDLLEGGIVGGGVIGNKGERLTVSEALRRFMESGEFRLGPNAHWQICCYALDPEGVATANLPVISDVSDVQTGSFSPTPRLDELENRLVYRHSMNWTTGQWGSDNNVLVNQTSVDGYQLTQSGEGNYYFLRSAAVAQWIAARRQERAKHVPVYVTFEGALGLTEHDLGDYVKLTHFRGIGAAGWTERLLWIVGVTVLPKERRVRLECLDVTDLFS